MQFFVPVALAQVWKRSQYNKWNSDKLFLKKVTSLVENQYLEKYSSERACCVKQKVWKQNLEYLQSPKIWKK